MKVTMKYYCIQMILAKIKKEVHLLLAFTIRKRGCSCAADPLVNCSDFCENNLAQSVKKKKKQCNTWKANL